MEVQVDLQHEIRKAIRDGLTVFITEMARGDIDTVEIVLQLPEEGYPVRLICASPFLNFENNWGKTWQTRHGNVIAKADLARNIYPQYRKYCFQIRNE